jgi:hypothetical protein
MLALGIRKAWMRKVLSTSQMASATTIDLIHSASQALKPGFRAA